VQLKLLILLNYLKCATLFEMRLKIFLQMTFNLFTTVSKGLSLFKQTNHNMMSFMSEAQFVTEELNMFLKLKY